MNKLKWVASCTVVLALLLAVAPRASAEVIFNDTLPFNFVVFNECTGELVQAEGEFHRVVSLVTQEDGTVKIKNQVVARGMGIGLSSGAKYRWNDKIHESVSNPPGVAYQLSSERFIRLIGLGSVPNEKILVNLDFEVDEFGVLTVVNVREVICQGD